MDIISELYRINAEKHVEKIDSVIWDILPDGITLEEISRRCKFISYTHSPDVKIFTLDGKPLLKIYPIEFKQEGTKITISQNVGTYKE